MKRKSWALLPLLLLITCTGFSQTPFFQHYYLLRKNEPVQVNTVFQDNAGFMWFGTDRGLFRFDGRNYKRYTVTDSLPDNHVTAIAQDSAGTLWTGHRNGKLSSQHGNIFREFKPPEGSATEPVSDILFDRKGRLWFSTFNDGLYYYRNNRLYRLDDLEGLPDLYVYDILEDDLGNIWAGTDGGVAICTLLSDSVSISVLNNADGLPDNIVKKLKIGEDRDVWLATEDAGIIRYDIEKSKFNPLMKSWKYGAVTDFAIRGDQIWIAAAQGVIVHTVSTRTTKEYAHSNGRTGESLTTLINDHEGNLWAGTKTGVIRTPGDILEFIDEPNNRGDRNVMALAMDHAGFIWFSTKDGLFKRKPGNDTVQKLLTDTPFKNFTVISLFADESGFLWAGLYGEGLLRIDPRTGKFRHFSKELRNGNVLNITGKGNIIWLATLGGAEKISVDGEKFSFRNYNSENGLSSDFIYQVFIDSKERVWFATDGKGADCLDKDGFHTVKGLTGKVVYGFAEGRPGMIWANVQNEGIFVYANKGFVTSLVFDKLQFSDNNIQALAADKSGNMILMHDRGIDIYNPHKENLQRLGDEAGIQSRRAHLNASARDTAGNILLGTDEGIIRCTVPGDREPVSPQVHIEAVRINGKAISAREHLTLSYDENNVVMNFLAFWYENPAAISFLYKMDTYDVDWIVTGDNTATYSQLPPGEYTFRLMAVGSATQVSRQEAVLHFTIMPPFWRTVTFYLVCAATLLAAGYSLLKYREQKLKHDKAELEAKVEERTREIQFKTEEIQAQNEEIMSQAEEIKGINENLEMLVNERTAELEKKNKALEEYAFINAHKLRSPVASILGLVYLLKKTPLSDEAKDINRYLQQSADELDDVVRSITKAIERGEK
jgi:ligand-binding sensor domain-containing protein